jgi:hypothetical protein
MSPLSEERLRWIEGRQKAIELAITELTRSPARHAGQGEQAALMQAHVSLRAERIALSAEATALSEFLTS